MGSVSHPLTNRFLYGPAGGFAKFYLDIVVPIAKQRQIVSGGTLPMVNVIEPFNGTKTHKEDYSFVNDLIGISKLFQKLGAMTRASLEQEKHKFNWQLKYTELPLIVAFLTRITRT